MAAQHETHDIDIQALMEKTGVKFGTSGIRGLVAAMDDALCFAYATAFFQSLDIKSGTTIAIAHDYRPSSPDIAAACYAAATYAGLVPEFCGAVPTPALAYYTECHSIPGIMITGSHIPFDRNGIKFYSADGEITKAEEQAIATAKVTIPTRELKAVLPSINTTARTQYIKRYTSFFNQGALKDTTVAFYQHSSVARDILTEILEQLGAQVLSLGRTDEFVPIDTEAVSKEDVARAQSWAKETPFDAIISTDGDADRPLIGDEKGQWMRGDIVGLLTAKLLKANAIVTPVSCNTAIEKSKLFEQVVRTRIGSPYVIEGMQTLGQEASNQVVGFEANGGFLLGYTVEDGERNITPLVTRDAVLPILAVLILAKKESSPLSTLADSLPSRFTASDRIKNFATEKSKTILQHLSESDAAIAALVGSIIGPHQSADTTDGLRITSAKGEIVHYRPSGNAPELRCYAEAETLARAQTLVDAALSAIQQVDY